MCQAADLREIAGHDELAQDQLGSAVQHQRIEDVVFPVGLEELVTVSVGQAGDQLFGVAGSVVARELKVRRTFGGDGPGIGLICVGNVLGGGDVSWCAHVDEPAALRGRAIRGRHLILIIRLRFIDRPAVNPCTLGGVKLHDHRVLTDADLYGRLFDILFYRQHGFGGVGIVHLVAQRAVKVDHNLPGFGRNVDLYGDSVLRSLDDVFVHWGLALERTATPAVGCQVLLQLPTAVFREVVPCIQI